MRGESVIGVQAKVLENEKNNSVLQCSAEKGLNNCATRINCVQDQETSEIYTGKCFQG